MRTAQLTASIIVVALAACGTESDVNEAPSDTSSSAGPVSSSSVEAAEALILAGAHPNLVLQIPARADLPFTLKNKLFDAEISVRVEGAIAVARSGERGEWTYRDALGKGGDLVLKETASGLEDWVRLATPGRLSYRVGLGPTIAGVRSLGANVEFLNASGTPVLRVGRAFAVDATGARAELGFTVEGCDVDVDPRVPWGRPVKSAGHECVLAVDVPSDMQGPVWVDPLWEMTDNLNIPRWGVMLATAGPGGNERVLAIGGPTGDDGDIATGVVEVYDPNTVSWSQLSPLADTVFEARAVTLADGRVLLIGGNREPLGPTAVADTLLFDPSMSTWSPAASMNVPRRRHTATLLADGRVLVTGGAFLNDSYSSAEVYDPVANTWTMTGSMSELRAESEAIRLPDGKVLVTGGYGGNNSNQNSSELWDPSAAGGIGAFDPEQVMPGGTYGHGIAMWGSDRVIVAGGEQNLQFGLFAFDQVYDVSAKSWTALPQGSKRAYGGMTTLIDGSAIVFGGCNANMNPTNTIPCIDPYDSARLYPAGGDSVVELPMDPLSLPRAKFGWASLSDGRVIAAGGGAGSAGVVTDRTDIFAFFALGMECTLMNQCASGFCVDGVCCESTCDGVCESCDAGVIGTAGQCTAFASGSDPENECLNDGALCLRTGECGASGCEFHASSDCEPTPCETGEECASEACSDELCCNTACAGICESCRTAETGETDGQCHPVLRATDPQGECVDGVAGDCEAQTLCDGNYECKVAAALCAPYACAQQGCNESCEDDDGCIDGFACIANQCVDEDTLCTDDTIGIAPDGALVDCAPFRCQPDGSCHEVCESLLQCDDGLVCDDATASCVDPPSASGGDEGCVCTAQTSDGGSLRGLAPWLLLLAVTRRRRHRLS